MPGASQLESRRPESRPSRTDHLIGAVVSPSTSHVRPQRQGHFIGTVLISIDDPMTNSQRRKSLSAPRHATTWNLTGVPDPRFGITTSPNTVQFRHIGVVSACAPCCLEEA